jgi:ABC-type branched-subunit amino acid transport system permease subunit
VGGLIYGVSKYYLAVYLPGFQLLVFAPVIIAVIVLFPEGTVGMIKRKLLGTALEKYIL